MRSGMLASDREARPAPSIAMAISFTKAPAQVSDGDQPVVVVPTSDANAVKISAARETGTKSRVW